MEVVIPDIGALAKEVFHLVAITFGTLGLAQICGKLDRVSFFDLTELNYF